MRRLISICAVCQDKHTLGKIVYDQALIHFALIDEVPTNIIKNSVKIGFREINIVHQESTRLAIAIFLVQMCTHLRFCVYVYVVTPLVAYSVVKACDPS